MACVLIRAEHHASGFSNDLDRPAHANFLTSLRPLWIEVCRAESDRKAPIVRQAFFRHQRHAVHFIGTQVLYRAVDRGNGSDHGGGLQAQILLFVGRVDAVELT
jgi:hypothetical protein